MVFQLLTQAKTSCVAATVIIATILISQHDLCAQYPGSDSISQIDQHLQFGEFSSALAIADSLPTSIADEQYAKISSLQNQSGANNVETLNKIKFDKVRFTALFQQGFGGPRNGFGGPGNGFGGPGNGPGNGVGNNGNLNGAANNGFAGGITEADFQPLINLVKSTIDPDSWDDSNGDGTIQPYPAGVYVDSAGTLQKLKVDSKRSLRKLTSSSSLDSGNRSVGHVSELRKVSLNRLEKQAQILAAQGNNPDDAMNNMAGIYEIEYLMFLPESNDIVIAGPAGDWEIGC